MLWGAWEIALEEEFVAVLENLLHQCRAIDFYNGMSHVKKEWMTKQERYREVKDLLCSDRRVSEKCLIASKPRMIFFIGHSKWFLDYILKFDFETTTELCRSAQ